jgi:hypothetical protein
LAVPTLAIEPPRLPEDLGGGIPKRAEVLLPAKGTTLLSVFGQEAQESSMIWGQTILIGSLSVKAAAKLVDRIQHMAPLRRLPEFTGEARDAP